MTKTPKVQEFCQRIWDLRERRELPAAMVLSRGLAVAVFGDVMGGECYNPFEDRRLEWAQAVIVQRNLLRPHLRPEADPNLENLMRWLLDREEHAMCGRDRAAGVEVLRVES